MCNVSSIGLTYLKFKKWLYPSQMQNKAVSGISPNMKTLCQESHLYLIALYRS